MSELISSLPPDPPNRNHPLRNRHPISSAVCRLLHLHLHLVDAFIQSDLQGCIHFTITLMEHCTSGAIRGFSVLLKDASTGNLTNNLLITKRLLYLLYHCRPLYNLFLYITAIWKMLFSLLLYNFCPFATGKKTNPILSV